MTLFSHKKLAKRIALFYIAANLFNVWLNRRCLDSLDCVCIQHTTLCCGGKICEENTLIQGCG